MYSYEEKIRAVKLLIKYEKCYAQIMRELVYQLQLLHTPKFFPLT